MKFEVENMSEEMQKFLRTLDGKTTYAIKRGLFEGAKIIAEAIDQSIDKIPEDYGYIDLSKPREKARLTGLLSKQIDGLEDGLGVSKMKREGDKITVSIGFDGYNNYKTKKYPNGQPNQLIARSLEKGTSYLAPNKFVSKAFKKIQARAEKAIVDEIQRVMTEERLK